MHRRDIILEKGQAQLDTWTEKIRELFASPECGLKAGRESYLQHSRELLSRRESVVVKLEKLRRMEGDRFDPARRELERAFEQLQTAWDSAVARIANTDVTSRR